MGIFEHFPYTNFQDLNLNQIIQFIKETITTIESFKNTLNEYDAEIETLTNYMNQLEKGDFSDGFIASLETYINTNIKSILDAWTGNVSFGLTDSGYFVAYIPKTWNNVIFKTSGYDIDIPYFNKYGHLCIVGDEV